jgi:hypothetical protein
MHHLSVLLALVCATSAFAMDPCFKALNFLVLPEVIRMPSPDNGAFFLNL